MLNLGPSFYTFKIFIEFSFILIPCPLSDFVWRVSNLFYFLIQLMCSLYLSLNVFPVFPVFSFSHDKHFNQRRLDYIYFVYCMQFLNFVLMYCLFYSIFKLYCLKIFVNLCISFQ
jgi:hypothetical protein